MNTALATYGMNMARQAVRNKYEKGIISDENS